MANNDIRIYFKKLRNDAVIPEYQTYGASGCDLVACEACEISPREICLVPTGIAIQLEEGIEAQIRPRSGLALKYGLTLVNAPGTVDSDYRGEIKVMLINLGKVPVTIEKGDRIAQMVFTGVYRGHFIELTNLDKTSRGDGGFGHTGK